MRKLKSLGLEVNTVIFYMPDHNVEPGKATCYEKGLKIPMIMKWSGRVREGLVIDSLVQTVDILPTILDAANIDAPSNTRLDGVSRVPLVEGRKSKVRDHVYFEVGYARAITDGRYKFIAFRYPESIIKGMEKGMLIMPLTISEHKAAAFMHSDRTLSSLFRSRSALRSEEEPL